MSAALLLKDSIERVRQARGLTEADEEKWIASQLHAGKRVRHHTGVYVYPRTSEGKTSYGVRRPTGMYTHHDTPEEAAREAMKHTK